MIPNDEPPPFFATWSRLYAAVIIYLFLLITMFYVFTVTFGGRP